MDVLVIQGLIVMILGALLTYGALWSLHTLHDAEMNQRRANRCNFNGARHEWGWTRQQSYMCLNCGKRPDEDVASKEDFEIED